MTKSSREQRPNQDVTFVSRANQNYSDNRYASSWRASLNWSVTDWLRIRGTKSQDIRNPSSRELFSSITTLDGGFGRLGNTSTIYNPWATGSNEIRDDYSSIRGGNEQLRNEGSTTTTLGVVLMPGGRASGLSFSADYSELRITGGVTYLDSLVPS